MGPLTLEKLTQYYPFDVPVSLRCAQRDASAPPKGRTALLRPRRYRRAVCLSHRKEGASCPHPAGRWIWGCLFVRRRVFDGDALQRARLQRRHRAVPCWEGGALSCSAAGRFGHSFLCIFSCRGVAGRHERTMPSAGFLRADTSRAAGALQSSAMKRTAFLKPAALFLCYPVLTMGEKTHAGSRALFLGKEAEDKALQREWSVEERVDATYPPTFLWQCTQDDTVPFENSLMMKAALERAGVPFGFMPVEGTKHGWGVAKNTPAEGWTQPRRKILSYHLRRRKKHESHPFENGISQRPFGHRHPKALAVLELRGRQKRRLLIASWHRRTARRCGTAEKSPPPPCARNFPKSLSRASAWNGKSSSGMKAGKGSGRNPPSLKWGSCLPPIGRQSGSREITRSTEKSAIPSTAFQKLFTAIGVQKARLYASACGLYEVRLNGVRVGDMVFAPGSTDYRKRIQYQTYDVTSLVKGGVNVMTAELADGWYRGSNGPQGRRNSFGTQTKLLCAARTLRFGR